MSTKTAPLRDSAIKVVKKSEYAPVVSEPTQEDISLLAYELWVKRGCPEGTHEEDWHQAENQLKANGASA